MVEGRSNVVEVDGKFVVKGSEDEKKALQAKKEREDRGEPAPTEPAIKTGVGGAKSGRRNVVEIDGKFYRKGSKDETQALKAQKERIKRGEPAPTEPAIKTGVGGSKAIGGNVEEIGGKFYVKGSDEARRAKEQVKRTEQEVQLKAGRQFKRQEIEATREKVKTDVTTGFVQQKIEREFGPKGEITGKVESRVKPTAPILVEKGPDGFFATRVTEETIRQSLVKTPMTKEERLNIFTETFTSLGALLGGRKSEPSTEFIEGVYETIASPVRGAGKAAAAAQRGKLGEAIKDPDVQSAAVVGTLVGASFTPAAPIVSVVVPAAVGFDIGATIAEPSPKKIGQTAALSALVVGPKSIRGVKAKQAEIIERADLKVGETFAERNPDLQVPRRVILEEGKPATVETLRIRQTEKGFDIEPLAPRQGRQLQLGEKPKDPFTLVAEKDIAEQTQIITRLQKEAKALRPKDVQRPLVEGKTPAEVKAEQPMVSGLTRQDITRLKTRQQKLTQEELPEQFNVRGEPFTIKDLDIAFIEPGSTSPVRSTLFKGPRSKRAELIVGQKKTTGRVSSLRGRVPRVSSEPAFATKVDPELLTRTRKSEITPIQDIPEDFQISSVKPETTPIEDISIRGTSIRTQDLESIREKVFQDSKADSKAGTEPIQDVSPIITEGAKQRQKQEFATPQIQETILSQPTQISRETPTIRPSRGSRLERPIESRLLDLELEDEDLRDDDEVIAIVGRRGNVFFEQLEAAPLSQAVLEGKRRVKETPAASVRFVKKEGFVTFEEEEEISKLLGPEFRRGKKDREAFVQKRRTRISTVGEKRGIPGMAKRKGRKKKKGRASDRRKSRKKRNQSFFGGRSLI